MISAILLGAMMVLGISAQSNTVSDILSALNPANLFDGPPSVSHAQTNNTVTEQATVENMQYYNYYAASTYCSNQLENLTCVYCQNYRSDVAVAEVEVLYNATENTLALVTVSDSRKEIVVTYRGSDTFLNFVQDFTAFDTDMGNDIKFHTGINIATQSLYKNVTAALKKQLSNNPDYKIVLVGHSLGGSMARLTLFYLLQAKQFPGAIYELYTYGELRVGNKAFVDYFNVLKMIIARCVNKADMAPHLPPTSVLGTTVLYDYYIQPHVEYWITNNTLQRFCNQTYLEDPTCSDSLGPNYNLDDHLTYFGLNYQLCGVFNLSVFLGFTSPTNQTNLPPVEGIVSTLVTGILNLLSYLFG